MYISLIGYIFTLLQKCPLCDGTFSVHFQKLYFKECNLVNTSENSEYGFQNSLDRKLC